MVGEATTLEVLEKALKGVVVSSFLYDMAAGINLALEWRLGEDLIKLF